MCPGGAAAARPRAAGAGEAEAKKVDERDYGPEETGSHPSPARSDRELLEEVLDSVRGFGRSPTMIARPLESERERAEKVVKEIDQLVMTSDHQVMAWRADADDGIVKFETRPAPSADLRRAAEAIALSHGVEIRVDALGD